MENYLKDIENKIKNKIKVEDIQIKDNTHKHKKHKFFQKDKFHLQLKIKSNYLNSLSRIDAQKNIMKILKEDLKNKIHALEILIK
tara:strand:+ start:137 stop:391 length:255 start_codon:yes stop_codon:yes gene_type:complete